MHLNRVFHRIVGTWRYSHGTITYITWYHTMHTLVHLGSVPYPQSYSHNNRKLHQDIKMYIDVCAIADICYIIHIDTHVPYMHAIGEYLFTARSYLAIRTYWLRYQNNIKDTSVCITGWTLRTLLDNILVPCVCYYNGTIICSIHCASSTSSWVVKHEIVWNW